MQADSLPSEPSGKSYIYISEKDVVVGRLWASKQCPYPNPPNFLNMSAYIKGNKTNRENKFPKKKRERATKKSQIEYTIFNERKLNGQHVYKDKK